MGILKKRTCRCAMSMLLCAVMLLGIVSPVFAAEPKENKQTATVTIEYVDENGQARYFLPPTLVEIPESNVLADVLNAAYQEKGEVTYSTVYGFTVSPKDGEPVKEEGWGKKAWWPFVNSAKTGNKYQVQPGEVVRFIYAQDARGTGFPGYVPPASQSQQGSVSVNKDKLIADLAKLTQKQIADNQAAYENALAVAIDLQASQEDVNAQAQKVADILNQEVPATDITVSPQSLNLMVGQSQQMTAELSPAESSDTVVWFSENTDVAQVTSDGVVYAVGTGTTYITAQANSHVKESVEITVTGIPTQSITLNKTNLVLEAGQGERLKAAVTPEDTTDTPVWTSSDPSVAVVDETGMVVGKAAGSATIGVVSGEKSASCTVTVTAREVVTEPTVVFSHTDGRITDLGDDNTIVLSPLDEGKFILEGYEGGTTYWSCSKKVEGSESSQIFIASGGKFYPEIGEYPAYVYDKNPEWYEDAQLIAQFVLKVVPTGVEELKLFMNGRELNTETPVQLSGTEAKTVTVKGKVDGVFIPIPGQALNATSTEGSYIYESFDVKNALDFFAENQDMHTFTISLLDNPEVKAEFQATSKKIDVTGLTVTYPETFYINNWNALGYQYVGITSHASEEEGRYEINIEPYNATVKDVQWVSHNPEIAEYQDAYGNGIVPKKAGVAKFTVTSTDNPAATQEITIRFAYKNPLEKVELEQDTYVLKQYESIDLNLLVTPANATNQRFTWTYSQDGIVQVTDQITSTPGTMTTTHALSALEQGTVTVTGTPIDDTLGANAISFTVTVTEASGAEDLDFDRYVTQNIDHSLTYLESELEGYYMYGSEWNLFTVLRAGGELKQTDLNQFYQSVAEKLKSGSRLLPTDYFRIVIALQVMGKDPTDVDGIDVIDRLVNYSNLDRLSSNMMAYTLMALDTKDYEVPENAKWTRESLLDMILAFQNPENGGFGLSDNKTVGVDITAMTLQTLAPYNNDQYPQVQAAIEKALSYLRSEMTTDCGYFVEGDDNACSAAQVLTALSVLGIDPLDPANGFTKGPNNLVVKMDQFRLDYGFTTFMNKRQPDTMAAAQIGYALEAYRRFAQGANSLFDMTDVDQMPQEEIDRLAAQEVMNLIGKIGTVTKDSKEQIAAARSAYDLLTDNQKKLVTNYPVLLEAEKAYAGLTDGGETTPPNPDTPQTGGETTPTNPNPPQTGGETTPTNPNVPQTGGETTSVNTNSSQTGGETTPENPDNPQTDSATTSANPDTPQTDSPASYLWLVWVGLAAVGVLVVILGITAYRKKKS